MALLENLGTLFLLTTLFLKRIQVQEFFIKARQCIAFSQKKLTHWFAKIYLLSLFLFLLLPIIAIIFLSFKTLHQGVWIFSLKNYTTLLGSFKTISPLKSLLLSLLLAFLSTSISTGIALLTTLIRQTKLLTLWKKIMMLVFALPILFFAMGILLTTSGNKFILLLLGHVLITLPYGIFFLNNAYKKIPRTLQQVSTTLGASRIKTIGKILIPLLLPTVLTIFSFNFILSLGEFTYSYVVSEGQLVTLPIYIMKFFNSYRSRIALALATIEICITMGVLLVINKRMKQYEV